MEAKRHVDFSREKSWGKETLFLHKFFFLFEIVFLFIEANKSVDGLAIVNHDYLYSACADDTTFFN